MADKPIDLLLHARIFVLSTRVEYQINPTPRALYEIIPFGELAIHENLHVKSLKFTYKRRNYILSFYRAKESGET